MSAHERRWSESRSEVCSQEIKWFTILLSKIIQMLRTVLYKCHGLSPLQHPELRPTVALCRDFGKYSRSLQASTAGPGLLSFTLSLLILYYGRSGRQMSLKPKEDSPPGEQRKWGARNVSCRILANWLNASNIVSKCWSNCMILLRMPHWSSLFGKGLMLWCHR